MQSDSNSDSCAHPYSNPNCYSAFLTDADTYPNTDTYSHASPCLAYTNSYPHSDTQALVTPRMGTVGKTSGDAAVSLP